MKLTTPAVEEISSRLEKIIAVTRNMLECVDQGLIDTAIAQLPMRQALLEEFVQLAVDRSNLSLEMRERVDELRELEATLGERIRRDREQMYAASSALRALAADPYREQLSNPIVLDRRV